MLGPNKARPRQLLFRCLSDRIFFVGASVFGSERGIKRPMLAGIAISLGVAVTGLARPRTGADAETSYDLWLRAALNIGLRDNKR